MNKEQKIAFNSNKFMKSTSLTPSRRVYDVSQVEETFVEEKKGKGKGKKAQTIDENAKHWRKLRLEGHERRRVRAQQKLLPANNNIAVR